MNTYEKTATDIRQTMRTAEGLADETLSTVATLKNKIIVARSHPEIASHEGQKALMRLQGAEQKILAGLNDLFRAHDEMTAIGTRMDVEHPKSPSALGRTDEEALAA